MMLGKLNSHMQKNESGPLSYTIHKNQLKMYWRLEHKIWTTKLLKKTQAVSSLTSVFMIFCLDLTVKEKATKANTSKWDYIKLKSFCSAKDTINKIKRQPTVWKKIFAKHFSDKGSKDKIYKELTQLNSK